MEKVILKEELRQVWISNPNKAELIANNASKAYLTGEMNRWLNEFKVETGVFAYKPNGSRILGQGLMHKLQLSKNEVSVKTIFGVINGTASEVVLKVEELISNQWLKDLVEDTDSSFISCDTTFDSVIQISLESKMNDLPQSFLRDTPDFAMKSVITFLWSLIVNQPGNIEKVVMENDMINVYTTQAGKFVGEKGQNIKKISAILGKDINVFSIE